MMPQRGVSGGISVAVSEPRSPLAPEPPEHMPAVPGVRLATAAAGMKYQDRDDVLLAVFDEGTHVAGVLTGSRTASAPVEWCREVLAPGTARGLVVNAGNANAFTGMRGREAAKATANAAAAAIGVPTESVLLASTGVIGEPLDPGAFTHLLDDMARAASAGGWAEAAAAIMTTDTFPKYAARQTEIGGVPITLNGIAKGSGMIAPDMATMLSFLFTDAPLSPAVLSTLLSEANATTFNAITVDGDTSTSDTVLFFATGKADVEGGLIEAPGDERLVAFRETLHDIMRDLAHQIVRDGEGATKFVTIDVTGAESGDAAKVVAMAIANSPLVKTAIAGEDANWGRVVMAVGKAGEAADRDRLAIWFGPHRVAVEGMRDPDYDEDSVSAYMKTPDIAIRADLGIGDGAFTVWTCDLTYGYISINADYRS